MKAGSRGRNVWMSDELWDALEKKAITLERSVNWLIGKAVQQFVQSQKPKNGGKKG